MPLDPPPRQGRGTTVHVAAAARGYDVRVERGLLARVPEHLARACPAHRYAIIADATVAALYGGALRDAVQASGPRADLFTFPAGEAHKTRETWAALTDAMLDAGIGRDGAVIALGGGVTGDLGGFVAATYLRGVPVVQVPTSLLAMIDASIGGKTGVDTPAGKNLVGAFHPPRLVLCDPDLLRTLPAAHLRAGLAEAVKHAAIADAGYFEWIEENAAALLNGDGAALEHLIAESVRIKARFVSEDEREAGPRKLLNFGHTIGHAVETASEYRLLHGEAVAIGMVAEARLGERYGVTAPGTAERLRVLLAKLCLPTSLPGDLDARAVLSGTGMDKKARAGRVEYALVGRIGAPAERWTYATPAELVEEVLRGMGS